MATCSCLPAGAPHVPTCSPRVPPEMGQLDPRASKASMDYLEMLELSKTDWRSLEAVIRQYLSTSARFGTRKQCRIIGEGNGFMSICCVIEPDWVSAERSDDLPRKIVYKFSYNGGLASIDSTMDGIEGAKPLTKDQMANMLRLAHNVESTFYNLLGHNAAYIGVPRPIGARKIDHPDDIGRLFIEYIEGSPSTSYENLKLEEADQVVQRIARLQVWGMKGGHCREDVFHWNSWREVGGQVLTPKALKNKLSKIPVEYSTELGPLVDELVECYDDFYDLNHIEDEKNEITQVLVNGDIWPPNLMWDDVSPGRSRHLNAVLDWQAVHAGSPAEDLLFFMACSLSGPDRRIYWRSALKKLYNHISHELGCPPPYTEDDLVASYDRLFPTIATLVVGRIALIFKYWIRTRGLPLEEELAMEAAMVDKMRCLMEDTLDVVHHNNYKIID